MRDMMLAMPVDLDQVRVENPPFVGQAFSQPNAPAQVVYPTPSHVAQMDFPIYLPGGKRGILLIPGAMTRKDYDLLKQQISSHLLIIEETSVSKEEPPLVSAQI
jgi:hypothetical protein